MKRLVFILALVAAMLQQHRQVDVALGQFEPVLRHGKELRSQLLPQARS